MRKSLENDLANNTFYEENCLSYDEFKMNMSEYSDTFSYDDWYRPYVFGKMHIIEDKEEKRKVIEKLAIKYSPKDSRKPRALPMSSSIQ